MKATLCVFVALVAVTSAAPSWIMRRGTCAANNEIPCTDQTITNVICKCGTTANCAKGNYCHTNACTPLCTNTDATTAASAACSCGSDYVAVAQNEFCAVKSNGAGLKLTTRACASGKTDGKTADTATCNCGLQSAVAVTTSEYCYLASATATGVKLTAPICSNTDATTAASAACVCGSDYVAVAQNEFCAVKSGGTGLKLTTRACDSGKTDGKTANTAACNCGLQSRVAVATTEYCYLASATATGVKLIAPICSNTDATTAA